MARQRYNSENWYYFEKLKNAVVSGEVKQTHSTIAIPYQATTFEIRKDKQSVMTGAVQSTTTTMQKTSAQIDFKAGDVISDSPTLENRNVVILVTKKLQNTRGNKHRQVPLYDYTIEFG